MRKVILARKNNPTLSLLFAAIRPMVLLLCIGCSQIFAPSPCERTQAIRDALEGATGRDCDIIRDDDLADVNRLAVGDLDELKRGDLDGLINLHALELSGNRLDKLPSGIFRELSNLESLNLSRNRLEKLPPRVFRDLSNLESLNLSHNQLVKLPSGVFHDLSNLESLSLSANGLETLPPGVFRDLSNLETLDLSHNHLTAFPVSMLEGLGNLARLELEGSLVDDLETEVCARTNEVRVPLLRATGLNCWQITRAHLSDISDLRIEAVQGAPFVTSRDFVGLTNLHTLTIKSDHMTSLPPGVFEALGSMHILILDIPSVQELPPGVFRGLSNLRTLNISPECARSGFFRFKNRHGALHIVHPDTFAELDNLRVLDLSCNSLAELPPGLFDHMTNLEQLVLDLNPGEPFTDSVSTLSAKYAIGLDRPDETPRRRSSGPTFTPTHTAPPRPTAIPTKAPTHTPQPTPMPEPTNTPWPTLAPKPTDTPKPTATPRPSPTITPTVSVTNRIDLYSWDKTECGVRTFLRLESGRDRNLQLAWQTGLGRKWPYPRYEDGDLGLSGNKSWLIYKDGAIIGYAPATWHGWHRYPIDSNAPDTQGKYWVVSSNKIACSNHVTVEP